MKTPKSPSWPEEPVIEHVMTFRRTVMSPTRYVSDRHADIFEVGIPRRGRSRQQQRPPETVSADILAASEARHELT